MNDTIETIDRHKKTPFSAWNKINRAKKTFNHDQNIKRNGKEMNLQQFLNENNKECTIYQVLKTYGGDKELTAKQLNVYHKAINEDLSAVKDLKSAFDIMKAAEQAWNTLPNQIKKDFDYDVNKFQTNGINWSKKKISEYNAKIEQLKPSTQTVNKEVTNG